MRDAESWTCVCAVVTAVALVGWAGLGWAGRPHIILHPMCGLQRSYLTQATRSLLPPAVVDEIHWNHSGHLIWYFTIQVPIRYGHAPGSSIPEVPKYSEARTCSSSTTGIPTGRLLLFSSRTLMTLVILLHVVLPVGTLPTYE